MCVQNSPPLSHLKKTSAPDLFSLSCEPRHSIFKIIKMVIKRPGALSYYLIFLNVTGFVMHRSIAGHNTYNLLIFTIDYS